MCRPLAELSDAQLLLALRQSEEGEPDWYDHGGEIQAAWWDAVHAEAQRRGLRS